ncbi:MAG: GspH/FimT family pseudopilin [Burkholderiales bacterium]|nr:MAG: GspH/FimT family pseudopilin [Burkholderiales bacterium]
MKLHRASRASTHASGFTLVEMLITMAIFAILTATALPSLKDFVANQRVRSVATDLHTSLLRARSEAIKRNGNVVVRPRGGSWTNGWEVIDPNEPARPIDVKSDVKSVGFVAAPLAYRSSGRLAATGTQSIEVYSTVSTEARRCVRTTLSGRPYVEMGGC